jgi:hypothetical protein
MCSFKTDIVTTYDGKKDYSTWSKDLGVQQDFLPRLEQESPVSILYTTQEEYVILCFEVLHQTNSNLIIKLKANIAPPNIFE